MRVEKLLEDLCSMNDLLKSLEMQLILKNSSTTLLLEKEKRKELGIENKFIIGHVGRYCYIKIKCF